MLLKTHNNQADLLLYQSFMCRHACFSKHTPTIQTATVSIIHLQVGMLPPKKKHTSSLLLYCDILYGLYVHITHTGYHSTNHSFAGRHASQNTTPREAVIIPIIHGQIGMPLKTQRPGKLPFNHSCIHLSYTTQRTSKLPL